MNSQCHFWRLGRCRVLLNWYSVRTPLHVQDSAKIPDVTLSKCRGLTCGQPTVPVHGAGVVPSRIMQASLRCIQSDHSRNVRTQQSVKRAFVKAYLSSLITGSLILLGSVYYYKSKRKGKREEFEHYKDTHFGGLGEMVKVRGFWVPKVIQETITHDVPSFTVRDTDVFVASFPKCGTTWLQEIIYLIQTGLDFDGASRQTMEERVPYLENVHPGIKAINESPSPRIIKSHLPLVLLPESLKRGQGKLVYITRNPKDVCVSYFHFLKMVVYFQYTGLFEDFFSSFMQGKVFYGPFWQHALQFWQRRYDGNVLFVTYEQLQKDSVGVIGQIAKFLGKPLSPSQLHLVAEHCRFDRMKDNPASNYSWWDSQGVRNKTGTHFMRKGQVGDWRNHLTEDMSEEMDKVTEQHFDPVGLKVKDIL